jgi:hypothetical protein
VHVHHLNQYFPELNHDDRNFSSKAFGTDYFLEFYESGGKLTHDIPTKIIKKKGMKDRKEIDLSDDKFLR